MTPGQKVSMQHPDGYATIDGRGGEFVGWIPNGIPGTIYLLTPDRRHAVVNFGGKLLATVELAHLATTDQTAAAPAA